MNPNNKSEHTEKSIDVYQVVTDRIIELLEQKQVPWRKPWTDRGMPQNLITKRPYRGINLMLLNSLDYEHSLYLTFKQLKTIGGSVNKGEKATMVVFTKMVEKEVEKDGKTETKKKSLLRYYNVFNVSQCRDIPETFMPKESPHPPLDFAYVIDEMPNPPVVVHKKKGAFYVPSEDIINMPKMNFFKAAEEYWGTLFHELIHATGHASRLNRTEVTENPTYGSEPYSLEELVAEIGSCFLKSLSGISIADMSNNAAYIDSWLSVLRNDKYFIIKASSRAQKAADYILNVKAVDATEDEKEGVSVEML